MFADFDPAGNDPQLTLGIRPHGPGTFDPQGAARAIAHGAGRRLHRHPRPATSEAGKQAKLTLTVAKDGKPVTDLEPYLAAYGHLVALREGDLAYLHVHPDGEPGDGTTKPGPSITFFAEVPSAGRYRLYLDFKHGGSRTYGRVHRRIEPNQHDRSLRGVHP